MSTYTDYLTRAQRSHGEKFDSSSLAPQFITWFNTGQRIKVRTTYSSGETYIRTGIVGVTTGWRPAFILMHRSNAFGSSDVLDARDEVIAVQRGRKYHELVKGENAYGMIEVAP